MTFCIVITRYKPGFYEWSVMCHQEQLENDAGENSIMSCLTSALACLPEDWRLVEVRYRGLHMGRSNSGISSNAQRK